MENILNKAKKDYLKQINKPKLEDIFTFRGFLSYFILRNKIPAIKDIIIYLFDVGELYLFYYLLGKDLFYIALLSFIIFKLINVGIKGVSYSIREKIIYLTNNNKQDQISKYFSSLLGSFLFFIVLIIIVIFLFSSSLSKILFLILLNRIISTFIYFISNIFFQATYIYKRIFISLFWLFVGKVLGLVFIILTFNFLNYLSFILFFYIDAILQFILTFYYCKKNLLILGYSLFSNLYKDYFSRLFWFIYENKTRFLIRFLSIFLINTNKLILLLVVYFFYPNYLILFFIMFQFFEFLFIGINRISKSLYFDIYKHTFSKNSLLINRLVINNFIFVLLFSILNLVILSKLDSLVLFLPKFELIYTNLLIFDRWSGLYFFVFFYSINIYFFKILEYSEAHIVNIIFQLISYVLLFLFLKNDSNFVFTENALSFFYNYGYVNLIIFILIIVFFMSKKWFSFSFLYNFNKYIKNFVSLDEFLDRRGYYYVLTLNKYFKSKIYLLIKILDEKALNFLVLKISNNSYIFNFSKNLNKEKLDKIILSNTAFMLDQLIFLNNTNLEFVIKNNKFFFNHMFPKLFSFNEVFNLKQDDLSCFNELNQIKINKKLKLSIDSFKNLYFDENKIFKKDLMFKIPVYNKLKFINFVEYKNLTSNDLKKFYRQIVYNIFYFLIEEINKS